jgi:antitoxin ParD1/3/4
MNVSLTPKLEQWVQDKVSNGYYTSSSEVVREALRTMAQYEAERSERLTELKQDVWIGMEQVAASQVVDFNHAEIEKIKQEARSAQ